MKYYFGLCCLVLYVSALDKQSIISEITSGEGSYCDSNNEFSSFALEEVPQFGAMCNIPTPKNDQLNFLLNNNVIPVLCMGVDDVFQRLCKSSKEGNIFGGTPWTVEKLSDIFQTLNNIDEFSSLDKFCSITVKKNLIVEPANKDTQFWWNELNNQFNNASSCKKVCRTYKENQVQPLCSFIMWTNEIYSKMQESTMKNHQPEAIGKNEGDSLNTGLSNVQRNEPSPSKENLLESNQITPTGAQNQLSTSSTIDSSSTTFESNQKELSKIIVDIAAQKQVASGEQVLASSTNNTQHLKVPVENGNFQANIGLVSKGEVSEDKPIVSENNKAELSNVNKFVVKPIEENRIHKEIVSNINNNTVHMQVPADNPKLNSDKSLQNVVKSGKAAVSMLQPLEEKKKMEIHSSDGTLESDFTIESTPDVFEPELNPANKELQQPLTDEEVEDGDGDDIDIEPEGSINSPPKLGPIDKMDSTNNKSSMPRFDKEAGDSDRAYGEVREVIIEDHFIEAEDSHFFTYFLFMAFLTIAAYLVFHNKKKLLALALEGRRTRGSRRRPNSSNYSKLDCSLEEAMASNTTATVTHVLY